jgi:hypothetical protein
MKIFIRTINHKDQRYATVGDWEFHDPSKIPISEPEENPNELWLKIKVSDLGDDKMNCLIAIHELIEALLCKFNDPEITGGSVDTFDMSHPELEEPGESLEAPYMIPHLVASNIEMMIAHRLKIDWKSYEERIKDL